MIATKEGSLIPFILVVLAMVLLSGFEINFRRGIRVAQQGNPTVSRRSSVQKHESSPYRQTLSPYLDLLRNDDSVLSPYHSFVRPRQQMRQSISQQAAVLRQLEKTVTQPFGVIPNQQRLPTGRGGSFNNHLHYYNFK
jgi:hypothetical protein